MDVDDNDQYGYEVLAGAALNEENSKLLQNGDNTEKKGTM